ncbi:expansin EXLX1 family cellulose-binding protein [Kitasatospora herbaricolor]|uniref:Expansin EXLX1 family cellulose-binding protein n=1 Tax=Kitasatospora herbaricolor TaxID=68217 RepID=A0ABZ1WH53_9ACTN|nr:expansin EXLX1 family cellulose-binding protein [Kitasatospora herbaricolor]
MRTTRHGAEQPPRKQRRALGIPLALLGVGVVACLAAALLAGGGADAGRPAGLPVTAAPAGVPADSGSPAAPAEATTAPTQPPVSSAPPPPTATPSGSPRTTPASSASALASAVSVGSLAGRVKPGVGNQGVATAYEAADGNGACLFGPSPDLMIAAMNHTDYETAKACGAYVLVRAANGASITVRITNECPLPCAPGQLDLSQQAFAKLADLKVGRLPITWTLLSPATAPATMSIRYKDGSSQYWCGIQVIGHRNPVATLEVRTAKGWRQLPRTGYNYFLATDGNGCGGTVRVTDVYGEQLTVDGIAIKPDVIQPTKVQFARH